MYRTLVTADELALLIDEGACLVVDCRHSPRDDGYGLRQYLKSHVATAIFASVTKDLASGNNGFGGRNPLPGMAEFDERLAAWGVDDDTRIVAYDDSGNNYAARFWWLCRRAGHEQVAVLDGGWQAWQCRDGGTPCAAVQGRPMLSSSVRRPTAVLTVSTEEVLGVIDDSEFLIIDARTPEAFSGEYEWQDPVAGHIPNSINHYYRNNLDASGFFKGPDKLREIFQGYIGDRPVDKVIHSCGSGINACHNLLAMQIAGLDGAKLYPGSWSEWCADKRRPVESGSDRST